MDAANPMPLDEARAYINSLDFTDMINKMVKYG